MTIYKEHGYESRMDYLETLSEEADIDLESLLLLADLLGPLEDFDGLVTTLEDIGHGIYYGIE